MVFSRGKALNVGILKFFPFFASMDNALGSTPPVQSKITLGVYQYTHERISSGEVDLILFDKRSA